MADDPYKYFRIEARELIDALSQGVMELEKGGPAKDLLGRLLRYAHTLKGAARIVKQARIAELSHSIEDLLSPHREGEMAVPSGQVTALLGLVDGIEACLRSLSPAAAETRPSVAPEEPPVQPVGEELLDTVRVNIVEMDRLLGGISEAGVQVAALRRAAAGLDGVIQAGRELARQAGGHIPATELLMASLRQVRQSLGTTAERLAREIDDAHERAGQLRLLPASSLAGGLKRAVRDASESLHKRVEFTMSGGEVRLDAHVLRGLREAVLQLVRNGIAHGIEPEARRVTLGKPPVGQIRLVVERRGSRIALICEDDGQGIDGEKVRRVAVERGLISADQARSLSPQAAVELSLLGGVTTTSTVTQAAGRGIGLDVVRATVERLKGEVHVHSEPSRGTRIELVVPVSLEVLTVLEVQSDGSVVSVPFDAVVGTVRVHAEDIVRSGDGESLLYDGRMVPFSLLERLMRPDSNPAPSPRVLSGVLLRAGSSLVAIGVGRLLRTAPVMVRPLPRLAGKVAMVTGASFDEEGNPQLVLDPRGLAEAVRQGRGRYVPRAPEKRPPVLVIDDSLTTRMLEESILETAGYEVELAVSGEEAMEKARRNRYAMFIVDVEMPGMDGFEFIRRVQADAELRRVPAILVTSRASAEDREEGQKAGARAYIVKGEFNEGNLLATIRRLIG